MSVSQRILQEMQFGQLPLFLTAPEILATHQVTPEDIRMGETPETTMARKLKEAQQPRGLYEHVEGGGTVPPIHLALTHDKGTEGRTIAGGHHRVATYNELKPELPLPVTHHTSVKDAWNLRKLGQVAGPTRDRLMETPGFAEAARDWRSGMRYY